MARKLLPFQSQQVAGGAVKVSTVLNSKEFTMGVYDAALGEPFDKSYESMTINQQWFYERGRLFALVCPGIGLKEGRTVTQAAIAAYSAARKRGDII
jgi:hypothetical protein